jgi:hypothetical protein
MGLEAQVNNKWKVVVAVVLLVLISAVGIRNLAMTVVASDAPVLVADGGGPPPPPPWKDGGGPPPPPPWKDGGGPPPPPPWKPVE